MFVTFEIRLPYILPLTLLSKRPFIEFIRFDTAQLEHDDDIVFYSGDTTTVHDDQAYIIEDMAEFMAVS